MNRVVEWCRGLSDISGAHANSVTGRLVSPVSLFASLLGAEFAKLDPGLRWVHGGESRKLRGTVTVERGTSFAAKVLGTLAQLPPSMADAPLEVHIETTGYRERWTRLFADRHRMVSTLVLGGDLLVERLGAAVLKFRLLARGGALEWQLVQISGAGIPLPLSWFRVSAASDMRGGRYHFAIDARVRGIGRIVRYEGLLDAKP